MAELRAIFARALAGADLAPGWTVDTAADWVWARVQPSAYAHLVQERGWTHEQFRERTIASLREEVLAAGGGQAPATSGLR